ncbi:MAG TPA: RdgB/HAM1 family non-canonical purine NTP pyrophosphatase [Chitinophagaceae bacterium]|jgi:XTP/dITP diphosphohydrolase|nr:RdgB/HAM1 family non-canonical purine NTP pyrophosphatase [Chitinophagaceae bacterium]
MELILATNNSHKVEELKAVLPPTILVRTLQDAGIDIDIPEPHPTLEENAAEKGRTIFARSGKPCLSDDSGLEVAALDGAPGVRSARYAGEPSDPAANIRKLLEELKGNAHRSAQFRTVIYLQLNNSAHYFEGICPGTITEAPRGTKGFGYDPVFVPEGTDKTFAEMDLAEKNRYSHRSRAVNKLVEFLNTIGYNQQD